MKFDVKCVREMLLSSGEVFTVRKWKSKNRFHVVEFEGIFYLVEKVKSVSGIKSLRKYVHKSGFDNVDDWWDAIKNFGALRGHLYHVTLLEEERQTDFYELTQDKCTTILPQKLIDLNRSMMQELTDCDRFVEQMSNEEYANARLFHHSDDEQEA